MIIKKYEREVTKITKIDLINDNIKIYLLHIPIIIVLIFKFLDKLLCFIASQSLRMIMSEE